MATSLRSFRPEDADAVVALSRQALSHPEEQVANPGWTSREELEAELADWTPRAEETLVVVEDDGEVVGFGGIEVAAGDGSADLFGPLVERRSQGRRLGTRLLEHSIALARTHRSPSLVAAVGTRNERGRALLARSGFKTRGRPQAMYVLRPQEHRPARDAPSGIRVRRAVAGDLERVLALRDECWPEGPFPGTWPASVERGFVWVAAGGDGPVAVVRIEPSDRWIYTVCVTAPERGRGVGGYLLSQALKDYWREHASHALGLHVEAGNLPAIRLYKRLGFTPVLVLQPYELPL